MAVILWMLLSLLAQGCWSSVEQKLGCMKWRLSGENVCCDACHPGHRVFNKCGPNPKDLCKLCEPGTFTVNPNAFSCTRCTQCLGAQVLVENCTPTTDTKCGCKEGLLCGNDRCSFCVEKCTEGHEPTDDRSCRPCPDGTFSDKSHQKCKPWSTRCPNPDQRIVAKGDAFTDIKCANVSLNKMIKPKQPDHTAQAWPLVISVVTSVAVMTFCIVIIVIVAVKILEKRKKTTKKPISKTPIIRPPTDDPRTLIAIECSFHEAQQEQGSSSESLDSKDSSEQLIAQRG